MQFNFKLKNPNSQKRFEETQSIRKKYPDRIPIIIEKNPNCKFLKDLDKVKFLVRGDLTLDHLIFIIQKKLKSLEIKMVDQEESIYLFVDGILSIDKRTNMSEIYEKFKDKQDGLLYFSYDNQNRTIWFSGIMLLFIDFLTFFIYLYDLITIDGE